MGSDGESDQASGTSSDEVQSPTGVCLRNRIHRRISMEVRHVCTHTLVQWLPKWLTQQVCIPTFTPFPLRLLCSSPPPPPPPPPRPLSLMGDLLLGGLEGWGCSSPNGLSVSGLHDTDSSPAPWGPQQWLVKRCTVLICAVGIFYMSDVSARPQSMLGLETPLFYLPKLCHSESHWHLNTCSTSEHVLYNDEITNCFPVTFLTSQIKYELHLHLSKQRLYRL